MSDEAAELRELVAVEHGLDPESAKLLIGSTLSELDGSAVALAKLLGDRREEPPADLLTAAGAAGRERKRSLENLLTRRPQQRDEHGRFVGERTGKGGGFDGGARPAAARTPEGHDAMLIRVLRSREADRGAGF